MNFDIAFGLSSSLSRWICLGCSVRFFEKFVQKKRNEKKTTEMQEWETEEKKPTKIIVKDDHRLDYVHSTK